MFYNFHKYETDVVDTRGEKYDYHSIMQYGKDAMTINGHITIETKDPDMMNVIGTAQKVGYKQNNVCPEKNDILE